MDNSKSSISTPKMIPPMAPDALRFLLNEVRLRPEQTPAEVRILLPLFK